MEFHFLMFMNHRWLLRTKTYWLEKVIKVSSLFVELLVKMVNKEVFFFKLKIYNIHTKNCVDMSLRLFPHYFYVKISKLYKNIISRA